MAGGGPFSARMTAPLCIAGGIALQMLKEKNIEIGAHLYAIAGIEDTPLDPVSVSAETLVKLQKMEFPVLSETAGKKWRKPFCRPKRPGFRGRHRRSVCDRTARRHRRSYVRWPGKLSGTDLFGIPAVKGVEFGAGFHATELRGSENNDPFYYDNHGQVKTRTNYHGGSWEASPPACRFWPDSLSSRLHPSAGSRIRWIWKHIKTKHSSSRAGTTLASLSEPFLSQKPLWLLVF